ncbi:fimbria/pilus outer membrane usher protein [Klebsiella variicola subsp. variicola]|nr:fimbria/pilus outer membrane usher protein [Klebsiella variicola subsp. variicola]
MNLSNSTTFDNSGFASNNTGLNGIAGSRDQFSYGVNLSHQQQNNETAAGANLTWNAPLATLSGSYSQSSNYTQASGSLSGGVVLWSGGRQPGESVIRHLRDFAGAGAGGGLCQWSEIPHH